VAASDARTRSLVERQARQRSSITLALLKALLGLWGGFNEWDNRDMVAAYAARSATLVDVALNKARRNARSFALQVLSDNDASPARVDPQQDFYPRDGTPSTEVYSRAARQYNYQRTQGKTEAEAREALNLRLELQSEMDVAAAERDELNALWNMSSKTIGWRRIIHPEKSMSGTCGLCVVAATRLYSMDDLRPLHDRCKCSELPVFKGSDPGLQLNEDDLDEIYAAAGSTGAADLKRTRVAIREHSELGPVLVREGANFRDVREVNRSANGREYKPYSRPTKESQRATWQKSMESSIRSMAALKTAQSAGSETVDFGTGRPIPVKNYAKAIQFHKDLIDRMRSKLL
jgi:hypothetical protein